MDMSQATAIYMDEGTADTPIVSIMGELKGREASAGSENNIDDTMSTGNRTNLPVHIPMHVIASPPKEIKSVFRLLQMWEGRVLYVDNNNQEFSAIITDKTNPAMADEKVSLSIEEISPNDLSLLKEGAVFYWSIGYADYPGRPRTRESRIRFRRLPKWSFQELNQARETGANLAKFFSSN